MPFQGQFVVFRMGLNTINLSTKFEVPKFAHYEDTKGNENIEIGIVLGG